LHTKVTVFLIVGAVQLGLGEISVSRARLWLSSPLCLLALLCATDGRNGSRVWKNNSRRELKETEQKMTVLKKQCKLMFFLDAIECDQSGLIRAFPTT
jgi:hypothetical protein